MSLHGYLLGEAAGSCPYIAGNEMTQERFVAESINEDDLDELLAAGYRHFGTYFFRPVCALCHKCVPLRIPVREYVFGRSGRRILNRGRGFLVTLERPRPSHDAYKLYLRHKRRFRPPEAGVAPNREGAAPFEEPPAAPETKTGAAPNDGVGRGSSAGASNELGAGEERYEEFVETFFHPFPFSYQLSVYDEGRLIAVSHIDMTKRSISAIYCYYDESYARESLGSLAILREIEIARDRNLDWVYLGYYIEENSHMRYKARFAPNEALLEEGNWVKLIDSGARNNDNIERTGSVEFIPRHRLRADARNE